MMTAMDAGSLPPALLRSGRIELWLETRLPDASARRTIISESLALLPPQFRAEDVSAIVNASQGLTGADLKSAVEDGKLLLAHDRTTGKAVRHMEEYFLEAIETIRSNRRNYGKRNPRPFGEEARIGFGS
jgi:ATP-dependent 26S proteasome regulatory subunit